MIQSELKKSEFADKAKQKLFIAKAYLALTVVGIVLSIGSSFYIVNSKGSANLKIAEVMQDSRDFVNATSEIKIELAKRQSQSIKYELNTFLPADENLTTLTRTFDELFAQWNSTIEPIDNNSLVFGSSTIDEEKSLSILPVTLTLSSSLNNFHRFLQAIETSGLPGSNLRLMDVQSISLNLGTTEEDGLINYTVNLSAYFQS